MTIATCIEMGICCGLSTLNESINNIESHRDIFPHDAYNAEMEELMNALNCLDEIDMDTDFNQLMVKLGYEKYYRTEEEFLYGCPTLRRII